MAVLALVLLFVLLALGAFFLAMSGGPSGARQKVQTQSRRGRKGAVALFVLALVVLGVAVPAYVIAQDKDRTAIPEANVTELTALQEHGRELFGQRCRNCHTLKAANATANVGPNLDDSPRAEALVLNAIIQGRAAGNGNMPRQVFEGEDAVAVAQFVAVATGGELATPEQREEQLRGEDASSESSDPSGAEDSSEDAADPGGGGVEGSTETEGEADTGVASD
jgi:mono/diheme cytochrome c family protein